MEKYAVVIGRFQPFHNGHKILIDKALEIADKCIVIIGSSQNKNTINDPLDFNLRKKYIEKIYNNPNVIILGLEDRIIYNDDLSWGEYLLDFIYKSINRLPNYFVFGSEERRTHWFNEESLKKIEIITIDRIKLPISASLIRNLILNNKLEEVNDIMPNTIDNNITKNEVINTIKNINNTIDMHDLSFLRVCSVSPKLSIANVSYNTKEIIRIIKGLEKRYVDIIATPELSLTGYTCQDLFHSTTLLNSVLKGIDDIINTLKELDRVMYVVVGAPLLENSKLYNTALLLSKDGIIGKWYKRYLPNTNEFYEKRWFEVPNNDDYDIVTFKLGNSSVRLGVEICEDLWTPIPPSSKMSINGCNLIINISSSNEVVGKYQYRKDLVRLQASKTLTAYVYTSSGVLESTSDLLFTGHQIIADPYKILNESERFSFDSTITITDIDFERINYDRMHNMSFHTELSNNTLVYEFDKLPYVDLNNYKKMPFVPNNPNVLDEILEIQSTALARRMHLLNNSKLVIGISGGSDSTLALIVCLKAMDKLNLDRKNIIAITMPGFGTSNRTYQNAVDLIKKSGATFKEISIKPGATQHYHDIEHDMTTLDVTYENVQARYRTMLLFNIANKENGIVVGTGDLSEIALGFCTYNADHMSNYAVNASIPKTLIKYLIECYANKEENKEIKELLYDVLNTPISPELLPPDKLGNILQETEKKIGAYILHDFYLYHFKRYGASIKKIYYLAINIFKDDFTKEEIINTLKTFIRRYFNQQFKRNCVPDGIKVGTISLSPRGDLRMPTEADSYIFLQELEECINNIN